MPFKSRAQQRKFFALEARGELPSGTTRRWAEHTKALKQLPERVKQSAKKKAPSRWEGATRGSGGGLATAGLLAGTTAGVLMAAKDLKRGNIVGAGKKIVGVGGAGWFTGALAGTAKGAISPKKAAWIKFSQLIVSRQSIITPSRTGAAQGTPIAGSALVAPAQQKLILPGATAPRKGLILPGQEAGAASRSSGGIILPERTSARPKTEAKAPQYSKKEKAVQAAADAEVRAAREKPKAAPKPEPKAAPRPEPKVPAPKPEPKVPAPKRRARVKPRGKIMQAILKRKRGLGLTALGLTTVGSAALAYKALKGKKPQGRQKAAADIAVEAGARHALQILVG